jgi:hypothetical protein
MAKRVQPSDQTSVRSSISHSLAQSQSSGALYGAEQCFAAHSYKLTAQLLVHLQNKVAKSSAD